MRSDYPNSDLINKVNSEWIDKVLVHPELYEADSGDEHGDLLQSDLTVTQMRPLPPLQVLAELRKLRHLPPSVTVKPTARSSRPRSIARRVSQRLALAVTALGIGAAAWTASRVPQAPNTVSVSETNTPPEEAGQTGTTALKLVEPAWFAPEILYATAIAPPPAQHEAPLLPKAGR
jgi:hypothetical protein